MKCSNCGYENPEGSTFCNFCGKPMRSPSAAAPPAPQEAYQQPAVTVDRPRNCVSCGRSISWTANVCPYCGHDYRAQMYGSPPQEVVSPGMRALFYILSFLIPIAGIIIGIVYYTRPDPESKRVGKNCIIIALVVWASVAVIVILAFSFLVASTGGFSILPTWLLAGKL